MIQIPKKILRQKTTKKSPEDYEDIANKSEENLGTKKTIKKKSPEEY